MSGVSSPEKCGQPFKIPDSVIRIPPHQLRGGVESEHPAVMPVGLADFLIRTFSADRDVVLDCFAGSGTTGVAAVRLGRKFTGIELEPKYFDIACRRISDALKQPDFFIEKPKPLRQETML
jgi:site-specific DNA-methyltransferase (adenine-specific)